MLKKTLCLLLAVCMICGVLPTTAFAEQPLSGSGEPEEHKHCWCGRTDCGSLGIDPASGKTHDPNIVWSQWSGTSGVSQNTYVYLAADKFDNDWQWLKGSLCLNGKVLQGTDDNAFKLSNSVGTITDCDTTTEHKFRVDNVDKPGLWILDEANGTETVTGGVITGFTESAIISHSMYNGATLHMHNGNIVGNMGYYSGAAIDTSNVSRVTINIYGGTIQGNYGTDYNGNTVDNRGTGGVLNIYGGTIANNVSTKTGSAVSAETVYMRGGAIKDNKCGGIDVGIGGSKTLTLEGNVFISGNTKADDENAAYNIWLNTRSDTRAKITIGSAGLTNTTKIGVTTANVPGTGTIQITGTNAVDYSSKFVSDNPSLYHIENSDNNVVVLKNGPTIETYLLSYDNSANGSFTVAAEDDADGVATGDEVAAGKKITVNPTPAPGYEVDTVTYNGTAVTKDSNDEYTFTMPAENVTVVVTFKAKAILYPVWVGTEQFTSEKLSINGGSGTADLTVGNDGGTPTYTLTLNNFSYTGAGYKYIEYSNAALYAAVYAKDIDLKVVLNGTNSLTCTNDHAIYVNGGNLHILGDGAADKLTADSRNHSINATNLKIEKAEVTQSDLLAYGNMDILESTVNSVDSEQDSTGRIDIGAVGNLNIFDSTINLTAGENFVYGNEKVTITKSTIETADGKYGSIHSKELTIDSSKVTVAEKDAAAILVSSKLAILNGSTVKSTVTGNNQLPFLVSGVAAFPDGNSKCDIVIDNSKLEADGMVFGIFAMGSMTVKGKSTVIANGNEMAIGKINMASASSEALIPTLDGTFAVFAGNDADTAADADASLAATYENKYVKIIYEEGQSGGENSGSGESGGSGNDNSGPSYDDDTDYEEDFWQQVEQMIREAQSGNKVIARAGGYDRMPVSVMNALRERDDILLEIHWDGGETILIPADKALNEPNRIYYPLSYLKDYDFGNVDASKFNPVTGGPLEVKAPAVSNSSVMPNGKPQITDPQRGLAETPELAERGIEQTIPGVYEPATENEEKNSSGGIWVLLAALAVGGGWFVWKKREKENAE